jgi:hypothetical protein
VDDMDVTSPMGRLPHTLSLPEAGDCLGVGRTTAHKLARIYRETGGAYGIPNIPVGHKLRVPGALLSEQVAEGRITPPDFAGERASRRPPSRDVSARREPPAIADELASRRRPSREVRTRREPPVDQLPLFPAG